MKKIVLPFVHLGLLVGVALAVGTVSGAWTGPTAAPPNNNVAPPVLTTAASQTITGNLYIGTGYGFSTPTLCIGTDCRSAWPVSSPGGITAVTTATCTQVLGCTATCPATYYRTGCSIKGTPGSFSDYGVAPSGTNACLCQSETWSTCYAYCAK